MYVNKHTLLGLEPIKNMLTSKFKSEQGSFGLTEGGYDVRIKQTIKFTKNEFGDHIVQMFDKEGNLLSEKLGNFTLASTIEEFQVPPNLEGSVHDKSTWARTGLSVFNTILEPNWHGFLTLELVYHGQDDLTIKAGSGIAQTLWHYVANEAYYDGKYQHQEDKPVEAIMDKDF